ncbi:MAG TPA: nucleotidyl transferase AbiEii/AbiGii toxin family protein [Pedobacter sp.]|nr:nucleotidyl transferase AbiEii/AbiGii toxin family protein [Pedobacter sp.]
MNHGKSNYVSGRIGEVDFDFISHKYTSIKPIATIEGIRMMSAEDIAAMKINAIVNSGQRVKDFIDMYYLFKKMSVDDGMGYYCAKYPNVDIDVARSSLLYHQDVDLNVPVLLMDRKLNWNAVAHGIKSAVWEFDNLQQARASYIKMQEAKKDRSKGQGNETGHGF